MPIYAVIGLSALGGILFSNKSDSSISAIEGLLAGVVLGVSAAAVFYTFKKL